MQTRAAQRFSPLAGKLTTDGDVDSALAIHRTLGHGLELQSKRPLLIQTKLAIGKPGDQYEQEADRTAERVMGMAEPSQQPVANHPRIRQPEHDDASIGAGIVRTKEVAGQASELSHNSEGPLSALRSGGSPLPASVRDFFEPRFGHNLSRVRIHSDSRAAQSARDFNARAFTVGRDIVFGEGQYAPRTEGGKRLLAHELTHVLQQRQSERIQCDKPKDPEPKLLTDFADKFKDAADFVRSSPAALTLVNEAQTAGVKFGGYAEDGPGKTAWAYTIGDTIYVPKSRLTDKILAASDFLFEMNNAMRKSQFAVLDKEAAKGAKGTLTAKDYAYKTVAVEVEGMLRLGEAWFEMKKPLKDADKYDSEFYLSEYQAVKDKKKTKDDVIKDVLKRVYSAGADKGKTVEQKYMDDYKALSGEK